LKALPKHIGIIMDGNGRWARSKRRPRTFGHLKGARVAKRIISYCARTGIPVLTLYAFSTENWLRPKEEVSFLFLLLRRHLLKERSSLMKQNIRFQALGDLNRLPQGILEVVIETMRMTANNNGMQLNFAISYGSRWEIVEAAKSLARKVKEHDLDPESITESVFAAHLESFPQPDVDLVIRTSGETRLSNFMLWQSAYAEIYFSDTLWPDFSSEELGEILQRFSSAERRFGALSPQQESHDESQY
jgi:undecaprenyl diphosphate synthase